MARVDQLAPSLRDPNYLMRRGRVVKLQEAFEKILVGHSSTRLLDVGGRDAPYKSLAQGRQVEWIVADLVVTANTDVGADAQCLPFGDESFDVVLCLQVLELVPNVSRAVGEMYRILKPGGCVVISNPAVYPPYGNARWRIMPDGYRQLLRDFSAVTIDAECNTVASFFRTTNVYVDILTQQIPVVRTMVRNLFFPVTNGLGWWANGRFKDKGFAANYFVVAQK